MTKVALTIAGSDSGGGAGLQADLKTFAFHRIHGTSAITCVTAQNTVRVTAVIPLSAKMVQAQIGAVAEDIGVDGTKTGMLFNAEIISAVADSVREWKLNTLVVDPVMVSRAGVQLIDNAAVECLVDRLFPLALLVTPNIYEARLLTGMEIKDLEDMKRAAAKIQSLGAARVLVKGGGMDGLLRGTDVWFDGREWETLSGKTVNTINTHGTGCTLSAAIVANLCAGRSLKASVMRAKHYVTSALEASLSIGRGSGPLGHFFPLPSSSSIHDE